MTAFLILGDDTRLDSSFLKNNLHDAITASGTMPRHNDNCRTHIEDLYAQLSKLIIKKVSLWQENMRGNFKFCNLNSISIELLTQF